MAAEAATVSHTGTYALSPYLNGGSFTFPAASFPKFDLAGQCLTAVCVRVDGGAAGLVAFENYQSFPVTVNVSFIGQITLQRPDLSTLVVVQPSTTITDNLPIYDNVLDYGGTSGRTYPNVSATQSDSLCVTNNSDLTLFSGAGTISLPAFATDLSSQGAPAAGRSACARTPRSPSRTRTWTAASRPIALPGRA